MKYQLYIHTPTIADQITHALPATEGVQIESFHPDHVRIMTDSESDLIDEMRRVDEIASRLQA